MTTGQGSIHKFFMVSWPFWLQAQINPTHYSSSVSDFRLHSKQTIPTVYYSIILGAFGREANGDEQLFCEIKQGA